MRSNYFLAFSLLSDSILHLLCFEAVSGKPPDQDPAVRSARENNVVARHESRLFVSTNPTTHYHKNEHS